MAFDIGEALEKAGVDDILLGNKQARGEKARLEASSDNPYFTDPDLGPDLLPKRSQMKKI